MEPFSQRTKQYFLHLSLYFKAMVRWMAISVLVGLPCGLLGAAFHHGVFLVTEFRTDHPWIIFFLPTGAVLCVLISRLLKTEGQGTNDIIHEVQAGEGLDLKLLPSIFLSTIATHLFGGSAGREGAALQMGGTIGFSIGKALKLDDRDRRTATMTGMAAFFSALFGTPLASSVFSLEVISVGLMYHAAFVPCFIASLASYLVSGLLKVAPTRFYVEVPAFDAVMLLKCAFLSLLLSWVSVLFCECLHFTEHFFSRYLKNVWIRALTGGAILLVLSLVFSSGDYNGAGMDVIIRAVESGEAAGYAFLLKILLTAVTLSSGFKGGEVVPSFFVGAVFGCAFGKFLGIPAGFAGAIGLICVFCGAVNCPIASMFLSVELFGAEGLLYFALACGISYVFSGYTGIYSSQRILYDKLKSRFIDVHTNAHHEGERTGAEDKYL